MANEITYTVAFEELQQIVRDMEDGEITVDELAIKVKRAAELIKVCKNKLTSTEEDVNLILKELYYEKKNPYPFYLFYLPCWFFTRRDAERRKI